MKSSKGKVYSILVYAILLAGVPLNLGSYPSDNKLGPPEIGLKSLYPTQTRILEEIELSCSNFACFSPFHSLSDQGLTFNIDLDSHSRISLDITVGKLKRMLLLTLTSDPTTSTKTEIELTPDDIFEHNINYPITGSSWEMNRMLEFSDFKLRSLEITIENESFHRTQIKLQITVLSSESVEDAVKKLIWLIPVIVIIVIFAIFVTAGYASCRKRRLRRLMATQAAQHQERENRESHPVTFYQPVYQQPQTYYQVVQIMPMSPPNHQMTSSIPPIHSVAINSYNEQLTEENINQYFPEILFENCQTSFPQQTCSICLQDLMKNETCRQLSCQHIFHSECAKMWLLNQAKKQNKRLCPNCNQ